MGQANAGSRYRSPEEIVKWFTTVCEMATPLPGLNLTPCSKHPEDPRAQRLGLVLDPGIKLAIPNIWVERDDPVWYIDLVMGEHTDDRHDITDTGIDLIPPTDGRPYRTVDFDEIAGAIEAGEFILCQATDAMRRWRMFLDTHIQRFAPYDVAPGPKDFPPRQIARLRDLEDSDFPDFTGKGTG